MFDTKVGELKSSNIIVDLSVFPFSSVRFSFLFFFFKACAHLVVLGLFGELTFLLSKYSLFVPCIRLLFLFFYVTN